MTSNFASLCNGRPRLHWHPVLIMHIKGLGGLRRWVRSEQKSCLRAGVQAAVVGACAELHRRTGSLQGAQEMAEEVLRG